MKRLIPTAKNLVLASLMAVCHLGIALPSWGKGGVSDGGGNLCYLSGQPYLLEFADLHRELVEPGIKIEPDAMADAVGFGSFTKLNNGRVNDRIEAILAANEKLSPIVTSWLHASVGSMDFSLTSLPIEAPVAADTTDQPLCQNGNTRASILFMPPMLGFVDRTQFNALDLDSQAGLLLHEAGRTLQAVLKTDSTGKSLAALSDRHMQQMIRTLFDVYKGRSTESVDKSSLIAAFTGRILIWTSERGLCMGDLTSQIAKADLKKRYKSSIEIWEIWNEQESIARSLPPPYSEICHWNETLALSEFSTRATMFKERILAGKYVGRDKKIMLALADRLQSVMDDPFNGRSAPAVTQKAVAKSLADFNMQIAHLQLGLSMMSASAKTVKEIRHYPSLTMKQQEAIAEYDYDTCNVRENLREWMQTGRIVEGLTDKTKTVSGYLNRPNSRCSKSSSWIFLNNNN